ncbi:hypothetical protein TNCV_4287501 [Trichonephila clavipes]|uniref:Uncharacterized protein n=1 Tax=Trichonephila clavipes TaxID=2585209 RepID=A0A8X6S6P4_TRICX|nr:hypothetical protein TNCV_4287501 [Trichonephila clavipes]
MIPFHVGITANQKDEQAADSFPPEFPLTLRTAKRAVPRHLERPEAVDHFYLLTGHPVLGVHLHRVGLAPDEASPYHGHDRMDGAYIPAPMHWTP